MKHSPRARKRSRRNSPSVSSHREFKDIPQRSGLTGLFREMFALDNDLRPTATMLFYSEMSRGIFLARMAMATLRCTRKLERARGKNRGRITEEFYDDIMNAWMYSLTDQNKLLM